MSRFLALASAAWLAGVTRQELANMLITQANGVTEAFQALSALRHYDFLRERERSCIDEK